MAMTWGWRSPRRKLKEGNSVIELPSGEMRVARHHHQLLDASFGYLTQTGSGVRQAPLSRAWSRLAMPASSMKVALTAPFAAADAVPASGVPMTPPGAIA